MRKSLKICIFTYAVVGTTGLIFKSGWVVESYSLWIHVLLYPLEIYSIFCIFPAFVCVMTGIQEIRAGKTKGISVISIVAGLVMMIGYTLAVKALWPALMGI